MLLSNYKKQTCSYLAIAISLKKDLHVAIFKREHLMITLLFLAAMLAFLLLKLFYK